MVILCVLECVTTTDLMLVYNQQFSKDNIYKLYNFSITIFFNQYSIYDHSVTIQYFLSL